MTAILPFTEKVAFAIRAEHGGKIAMRSGHRKAGVK
jgi:hypothetical protein